MHWGQLYWGKHCLLDTVVVTRSQFLVLFVQQNFVFDNTNKLYVVIDDKMRCLNVLVELFLISYLLAKFASFATGQLKIRRLSQKLPLRPLRTKFIRGKHLCMNFYLQLISFLESMLERKLLSYLGKLFKFWFLKGNVNANSNLT